MPRSAPAAASHSLTVLSCDAEAITWPSGKKVTALTPPVCGDSARKGSEEKFDEIYMIVRSRSISGGYNNGERQELLGLFRDVVGSIVILFNPLPATVLARLLDKLAENVHQTLNDLYSVLEVPNDQETPVRLMHPSFTTSFSIRRDAQTRSSGWMSVKHTTDYL